MKKVFRNSLKVLGILILLAVISGLGGWWYINSTFLSFEKDYAENINHDFNFNMRFKASHEVFDQSIQFLKRHS